MKKTLTIIIPVTKTAYFQDCLESIESQKKENTDVLVIDNTGKCILQKDSRYTLISRKEQLPIYENWSDAISHLDSEYFMILSDDDKISPNTLQKAIEEILIKKPKLIIFGMERISEDGKHVRLINDYPKVEKKEYSFLNLALGKRDVGLNFIAERAFFNQIGGFERPHTNGVWIDHMYYLKCASFVDISFSEIILLQYRIVSTSVSNSQKVVELLKGRLVYDKFVEALLAKNILGESLCKQILIYREKYLKNLIGNIVTFSLIRFKISSFREIFLISRNSLKINSINFVGIILKSFYFKLKSFCKK